MQAKYDGWLMKKLAFIQGRRPDKRHFDVPTIPKFAFDMKNLEHLEVDDDPELGWDVIWENGLPYREDRYMMEKNYYVMTANGKYVSSYGDSLYQRQRHKSRIYTWRYPNDPLDLPPELIGLADVAGNPLRLKATSYVWIGGEHHTPYGHYAKHRGTDRPLPELLSKSYGYMPNDGKHILLEAGEIVISGGRVLTSQPSRPDILIILTRVGSFCIQDVDLLGPL